MRKLGINTDFIGSYQDFDGGYAAVKAVGFDSIFVCDEDTALTERHIVAAKKAGLAVDFLHAPWHKINTVWLEGDMGDAVIARLTETLNLCAEHQIPIAIVHLSSGENAPCVTDIGHRRFDKLVAHAALLGVKIAFENQRKLANLAFVMELYKDKEAVGFCWDSGHEACFTMGKINFMGLFADRLLALHLHDNEGVYDLDSHYLPFDAQNDFSVVAEKIKRAHYPGTVMLEIKREQYKALSDEDFLRRALLAAEKLRGMIDG